MEDAFVNIDLSEDEFDQILDFVSEQKINTGLGKLYDRLYEALEARNQDEEEAEEEEEADAEDAEDEEEFAEEDE